ncbi:MAG: hypothetical protein ACE5FO_00560 [Parvularculaceae bacterium]
MSRLALLFFIAAVSLAGPAGADDLNLQAGQAWKFKDAPSPDAIVIIGRIDRDVDPMIAHVAIEGLPNIQRDPEPLRGGVIAQEAGRNEDKFWCKYSLKPSPDNKSVEISVIYMPIEYNALASSLTTLEASDVALNDQFQYEYDNWDYMRVENGYEETDGAIAIKPLSESVQMIIASAKSAISMLKRILPEIERMQDKMRNKEQ